MLTIILSIIGIHVLELWVIGTILLLRRNKALEKAILENKEYIDAISILISNSRQHLKELDTNGGFQSDDEIGTFFNNLKEIQNTLDDFNTRMR